MTNLLRQITISAAAIALAAVMVGKASAEVVTFDAQPAGTFTSFTEGSFTVTANPGDPGDNPTIVNVGAPNQNVVVDGNIGDVFGSSFEVTETDGGLFSLNSIDVADLQNDGGGAVFCGAGFRIELTDNLGDCADYGPGSSTFTTVSPSSGFSNISSLTVDLVSLSGVGDYAVDNINLTAAAPEPSTLILAFGGLVGLGVSARRRRARL